MAPKSRVSIEAAAAWPPTANRRGAGGCRRPFLTSTPALANAPTSSARAAICTPNNAFTGKLDGEAGASRTGMMDAAPIAVRTRSAPRLCCARRRRKKSAGGRRPVAAIRLRGRRGFNAWHRIHHSRQLSHPVHRKRGAFDRGLRPVSSQPSAPVSRSSQSRPRGVVVTHASHDEIGPRDGLAWGQGDRGSQVPQRLAARDGAHTYHTGKTWCPALTRAWAMRESIAPRPTRKRRHLDAPGGRRTRGIASATGDASRLRVHLDHARGQSPPHESTRPGSLTTRFRAWPRCDGIAHAQALVSAGHQVTCGIAPSRAARRLGPGTTIALSPREAVAEPIFVIAMGA